MAHDPPPQTQDTLAAIPEPIEVRWLIGVKYAEILVLKKLLRAAESRDRLFPSPASPNAEQREVAHVG